VDEPKKAVELLPPTLKKNTFLINARMAKAGDVMQPGLFEMAGLSL
jgi:hypothetical protein